MLEKFGFDEKHYCLIDKQTIPFSFLFTFTKNDVFCSETTYSLAEFSQINYVELALERNAVIPNTRNDL